jgi:hypothetical protein
MHTSIYREFHIGLAPNVEKRELARGVEHDEAVLYIKLQHVRSGEEAVFKLLGATGTPERWIEEQVMRRFPSSDAAAALRQMYGRNRHRLTAGWEHAFGERVYQSLTQFGDSKGAQYWAELIPTLPSVLYRTMNNRAVSNLSQLGREVEFKDIMKAVHDGWLAVLKEARAIGMQVTGLQRLALDMSGWPTDHLRGLSTLEYAQFKEKAHFARLSLGYLEEQDWSAALMPMLEDAPPPSATHPATTIAELK